MKFRLSCFVWASLLGVVGLAAVSCQREPLGLDVVKAGLSGSEIVFTAEVPDEGQTKADVTTLSSFNVACVTGSAGSEAHAWTVNGTGGSTGKYWPASDPGYKFYASNVALTFNAAGCTVAASNGTDVVVCYKNNPTYKSSNTLQFSHIFGQIGNVTVSPDTGFIATDITNVSITITPKTAGTYNLRTGAWSSVTTGSAVTISNSSPGTKSNGLNLVPGSYTISGTWQSKGKDFADTGNITVVAGQKLNLNIALGGVLVIIPSSIPDYISWSGTDLSLIHPISRTSVARETANCYVVTEPGTYKIPLFYGNSIVNGANNFSTAAPAYASGGYKIKFVNGYNEVMYSGNIKEDLEHSSHILNTGGGKLVWSSPSSTNASLVYVSPDLEVVDGIAYLIFNIPTVGYQEGCATIGLLKDGSTTEYVWTWMIWLVNGKNQLAVDSYVNSFGYSKTLLNRTLGASAAPSYDGTYYQWGMPYALPPNKTLYYSDSNPNTYSYDGSTISNMGLAIAKPYMPRWSNTPLLSSGGTSYSYAYNNWDASRVNDNAAVNPVKTVYDPCPAGFCVPRRDMVSNFSTSNVVGSFSSGYYFKKSSSDATGAFWGASGRRRTGTSVEYNNSRGFYWGAQPSSSSYGYSLYFLSGTVTPEYTSDYRYYAESVRPATVSQPEQGLVGTDLSTIHPITRATVARETANCYIVTEPGIYRIPLYYGNSIVNGANNFSTAAPAYSSGGYKIKFVNGYNDVLYSGNVKEDLEYRSRGLNTQGGKLVWSTGNSSSASLVEVDSEIHVEDGVAWLIFSVPSAGFKEGCATVGLLKSGSTTEYVWTWMIWIVDGSNQLTTETYTNSSSVTVSMLNRTLGSSSSTGYDGTYYQWGMPYALPPSGTLYYSPSNPNTYTYDSGASITTMGGAIAKPYSPRWASDHLKSSGGTTYNYAYNNWDASRTNNNTAANPVKTVYDPCPAGFCVPRRDAFTYFSTTNKVGSFSNGYYFKKNSSDATGSFWGASGRRQSSTSVTQNRTYGYYWGAQPYSSNYGYSLYFRSTTVSTARTNDNRYYGQSIRPAVVQ